MKTTPRRSLPGTRLRFDPARTALAALALLSVGAMESAAQTETPTPYAAPADGGPRNWQVEVGTVLLLRTAPSADASIAGRYPDGAILDNLGCAAADGRVWCDVQELGGGPRGYVAADFLRPARAPDGVPHYGPDDSALRAGRGDFDASGSIVCRMDGAPAGECPFTVARSGGGYATVVVVRPDGGSRAIFFRMGIPVGADQAQAEGDMRFGIERRGDAYEVRAGPITYEIVDAVVLGG